MSLSATGGGNASGELASAILQVLESAKYTSSGGDSPKVNTYIPGSVDSVDFATILDSAVTTAVLRHMEDNGLIGGGGGEGGAEAGDLPGVGGLLGSAKNTASIAQNPVSLVSTALQFLPHAVLVSFAVSLIPMILDELTKPGGEFDLRFKRIMSEEFNALQNRQTQFDISIGERGVIVQGKTGLLNTQGAHSNTNTLRSIREGGIDKQRLTETDYVDHSQGFDI